jgi:hypothetical protein
VLSVETLIFSKLIVTRRRSVVVVDISTTGAKLPLRIERAQFSERNKVEPHGLFYNKAAKMESPRKQTFMQIEDVPEVEHQPRLISENFTVVNLFVRSRTRSGQT